MDTPEHLPGEIFRAHFLEQLEASEAENAQLRQQVVYRQGFMDGYTAAMEQHLEALGRAPRLAAEQVLEMLHAHKSQGAFGLVPSEPSKSESPNA